MFLFLRFSLVRQTFPSDRQVQSQVIFNPVSQSHHKLPWEGAPLKLHTFSYQTAICFLQRLRCLRALRGPRYLQCPSCLPTVSRKQFPNLRYWKIRSQITLTSRTFRNKSLRPIYLRENHRISQSLVRLRLTGRSLPKMWLCLSVGKCRRIFQVSLENLRSQWH